MMNDKTKLVKEAKNDKASRCCWSAYQKKIRRNATQPDETAKSDSRSDADANVATSLGHIPLTHCYRPTGLKHSLRPLQTVV